MSDSRNRILQGVWLLLAAALLTGAGLLLRPLDRVSQESGLVPPGDVVKRRNPQASVLAFLPGAIRAPALAYLWIEAEELKNQGKVYDALQKAQFICSLQPHFSGGIVFQAWNMAYNISVTTHTLDHRWMWVYNGVKLLRDEGIPQNPWSISLYRELSWIYFHKIGGFLDDHHDGYKRRWAGLMQRLLAPPPWGTTEETIAAFAPIAAAPLDRDPTRQADRVSQPNDVQQDQLAIVLRDANCAEYARLLGEAGVSIDAALLNAYNRYSRDEAIRAIRPLAPRLPEENTREGAVAALINTKEPRLAGARAALLAFVRAQLLWNQYRMDPQWMLGLMRKYGPLDWRLPWPHSLYWATYGFHAAEGTPLESIEKIESLTNSRIVLFSLKDLTSQGLVTLEEDPEHLDTPILRTFPDPRFVAPTQREYLRLIAKAAKDRPTETEQDNVFRAGHMNYLANAIQMLYVLYRHDEAREYLQYLKDTYKFTGGEWDAKDVEDFVILRLNSDKDPGRETAQSLIPTSLQTAYLQALQGNGRGSDTMLAFARKVYEMYQKAVPERNHLPPLIYIEADVVAFLLARPQMVGYYLTLQQRSQLWGMVDPRIQAMIYPRLAPILRELCQAEGIRFDVAFPAPAR